MIVKKHIISLFLVSWFLFLVWPPFVLGQVSTTEVIDATVKISICGNGVKEGGEGCDKTGFGRKSCKSLGYASGRLGCDIACDVITSSCVLESTTDSDTTETTSTVTTSTADDNVVVESFITFTLPVVSPTLVLPQILIYFDLDNSGGIDRAEMANAISSWVDEWVKVLVKNMAGTTEGVFDKEDLVKCDINGDGSCDLVDFSALLFYIEER